MSIINPIGTENRDVESGANASDRASYGTDNGENLSFEDSTKDEPSKEGSKEALTSRTAEKKQNESNHLEKEDPFGNEEDSEVKYKTMAWWCVSSTCFVMGSSGLTMI